MCLPSLFVTDRSTHGPTTNQRTDIMVQRDVTFPLILFSVSSKSMDMNEDLENLNKNDDLENSNMNDEDLENLNKNDDLETALRAKCWLVVV